MDYNKTLNLPKTEFPMRASLPQREPEFLKGWEKRKLYNQLMEHNEGKPLFVLHDGPPYANGSIHIGHALNKTLKDFIVRYKNMTGFKSPYVPGWDTHGLPTELAARKKAGITAESNISDLELRKICRDTALGFVDIQREGFKRLGVMAEWDHPYITLQKEFEQEQIKVFAQMASKGYIYKGLKPVYWCPDCKTALAEAEIEYAEDPCHSIYVKFKVTDDMGKLTALGAELDKTYFVIWTTTTWTLPANVAICVGPNYEYSVLKANGEYYVMATDLAPEAMADAGITDYETVGIIKGSELEYMKTAHPFIDRTSLVIVGDHVTLESGTGCVHTAPGHGVDDFVVCRKYPEIPIVVPVDENGVLTEEAGQFAGLTSRLQSILKSSAHFSHSKRLSTNIRTVGDATSRLSSEQQASGSALLTISRMRQLKQQRMLNGIPSGARTDFNQWLLSVPIGVFPVRENGAFRFLLYIVRSAARKSLMTA